MYVGEGGDGGQDSNSTTSSSRVNHKGLRF